MVRHAISTENTHALFLIISLNDKQHHALKIEYAADCRSPYACACAVNLRSVRGMYAPLGDRGSCNTEPTVHRECHSSAVSQIRSDKSLGRRVQSEMGLGFSVSFRKRGLETSSSERIRKPHCEVAVCACCGWSPAARSTY